MRVIALLGAVVAFALAACALHNPVPVQPDYPPPPLDINAARDAGRG